MIHRSLDEIERLIEKLVNMLPQPPDGIAIHKKDHAAVHVSRVQSKIHA
jgi:hypothetical protein